MKSLEDINPVKGTASNAQIMFLVLHTSGLVLIPLSILLTGSQQINRCHKCIYSLCAGHGNYYACRDIYCKHQTKNKMGWYLPPGSAGYC